MGADCCADTAIALSTASEAVRNRLQRAMRYYTIRVFRQSNAQEAKSAHFMSAQSRGGQRQVQIGMLESRCHTLDFRIAQPQAFRFRAPCRDGLAGLARNCTSVARS